MGRSNERRTADPRDVGRTLSHLFTILLVVLTVCMSLRARRFLPVATLIATPAVAAQFTWLFRSIPLAWAAAFLTPALVYFVPYTELIARQFPGLLTDPSDAAKTIAPGRVGRVEQLMWPLEAVLLAISPLVVYFVYRWAAPLWRGGDAEHSWWNRFFRWINDDRRGGWPTIALTLALLLGSVPAIDYLRLHYRAAHPDHAPHTLFERMVFMTKYPSGAAAFLNANEVGGRIYNDWRWEGFLKWHCPQVKVFLGGRSRQVYTPEAAIRYQNVVYGGGVEHLGELGVHVMVLGRKDFRFGRSVVLSEAAKWAIVYFDGRAMILASRDGEEASRLIDRAAAGELTYPDERSAKMSRAMCLMSPTAKASTEAIQQSVAAATAEWPNWFVYLLLVDMNNTRKVSAQWLVAFLVSESLRLESVDHHLANGAEILSSRAYVSTLLENANKLQKKERQAAFWANHARQVNAQLAAFRANRPEPGIPPIPRRSTPKTTKTTTAGS